MCVHTIKLLLVAWSIGFWGGLFLFLFRLHGVIRISGYESRKFKSNAGKGVLVLSRHPSMMEMVALPLLLLFPQFLFHPSLMPYQTPDIKWYRLLLFLHPIFIPVDRGNRVKKVQALRAMKAHLRGGGILVVAPEGGRTYKGTGFKCLVDGKLVVVQKPENGINLNDPIIRPFQPGIGFLAGDGTPVVVVWVEPRGRGLNIKIGPRVLFDPSFSREQISAALEVIMLRTAEEE